MKFRLFLKSKQHLSKKMR